MDKVNERDTKGLLNQNCLRLVVDYGILLVCLQLMGFALRILVIKSRAQ